MTKVRKQQEKQNLAREIIDQDRQTRVPTVAFRNENHKAREINDEAVTSATDLKTKAISTFTQGFIQSAHNKKRRNDGTSSSGVMLTMLNDSTAKLKQVGENKAPMAATAKHFENS